MLTIRAALLFCLLQTVSSWVLPPACLRSSTSLRRPPSLTSPRMQARNAEEALKILAEKKKAKISLSKFESYTVRMKKPMGLVFEENAVRTKGLYVAAINKELTNPANLQGWGFDEIALRDQLIRVNDMQGKETDARCLDFDTAIALIAESPSEEMELTFAATGGAI
eukprot:CAMPEP_0181320274 /NCGR_PEP_ID=MMETSP1101-20121128/18033_1 /TAXON_ID=46948 /ORGANISM="Rhodomonas abbreviata, Strain Caron Lab Isolate" /LENGTH=166 /DNA_ID=CAMNT_0023427961 /DNA_START=16 /DNA_END=516 /DNA_ORIENTATION=+